MFLIICSDSFEDFLYFFRFVFLELTKKKKVQMAICDPLKSRFYANLSQRTLNEKNSHKMQMAVVG